MAHASTPKEDATRCEDVAYKSADTFQDIMSIMAAQCMQHDCLNSLHPLLLQQKYRPVGRYIQSMPSDSKSSTAVNNT
jgi:hypothetical protein